MSRTYSVFRLLPPVYESPKKGLFALQMANVPSSKILGSMEYFSSSETLTYSAHTPTQKDCPPFFPATEVPT